MSKNEFSFEQTNVVRQAVDIVLRHLGNVEEADLKKEIARIFLSIASQGDHEVDTLVVLTIEKLGQPARGDRLISARRRSVQWCDR